METDFLIPIVIERQVIRSKGKQGIIEIDTEYFDKVIEYYLGKEEVGKHAYIMFKDVKVIPDSFLEKGKIQSYIITTDERV